MSDRENKNRHFYDFVAEQTRKHPWVSPDFEDEWLQRATFHLHIEPFEARSLLLGATASCNGFVQTEVQRILEEWVILYADHKGYLSKDSFFRLVEITKAMGRGALDQKGAEQLVKDSALRRSIKPKRSGLLRSKRWFCKAGFERRTNDRA